MDTRQRITGCVVALAVLLLAWNQRAVGQSEEQHGTCAITLATSDAIAVVVDSKLTRAGSTKSCIEKNPPGCKAVLLRKDVLLVVTGVFNDPVNGNDWKVTEQTRKLLLNLPTALEERDLDKFAKEWFRVLVIHFRGKAKLGAVPGRVVSTLVIARRIHDAPYDLKVEVTLRPDGRFRMDSSNLIVGPHPNLSFAGSCHDNVNSWATGSYVPAIDPPNPTYGKELAELGARKDLATTAAEFVPLLKSYEGLFSRIGNSEGKCWIGPPYDVATWEKGADGWTTDFKVACRARKSATH